MLAEALAVLEAARNLAPERIPTAPGQWSLHCEPRKMPARIRELGEAIEAFDRATGNPRDPVSLLVRAIRFASERGISPEEMVASITADKDELRDATSVEVLRPQPGEIGPPDRVSDNSPFSAPAPAPGFEGDSPELAGKYTAPQPAAVPQQLQPVSAPVKLVVGGPYLQEFSREMLIDYDKAIADGGEYGVDAGAEIDAIGDRLEYAVGRFGWTPKLRMLAAAYIRARNEAAADDAAPAMGLIARIAAEIRQIELEPGYAFDNDPDYPMPTPKLTAR